MRSFTMKWKCDFVVFWDLLRSVARRVRPSFTCSWSVHVSRMLQMFARATSVSRPMVLVS